MERRGADDESSSALTQTVQRAMMVLSCFSEARTRLRGAEIARELGLSQSTVSRLLATLESLDFVERDAETGMFQLGWQLVSLAGIVLNSSELRKQAEEELVDFSRAMGLSAHLAIRRGDGILYIATVNGPHTPGPYTRVGRRNPLYCTALGKVLLAHLPDDEREAVLARLAYRRHTPNTAGSAEELRPRLERILAQGYAVESEEIVFGRGCLAAPVRDASGRVVAALSVSGTLTTLPLRTREGELAARVMEQADRVSYRLGYVTIPTANVAGR